MRSSCYQGSGWRIVLFWPNDDSLADSDKLPPRCVIAREIMADLEATIEQFRLIVGT